MTATHVDAPVGALRDLAVAMRAATDLDDVLDAAAEASLGLLRADSVRVLHIDGAHGRIHVLRRAGALPHEPRDLEDSYLLADYPTVMVEPETARASAFALSDPQASEREVADLRRFGACASLRIPLMLPGTQWGAVYALRAHDEPFGDDDVAVAEVVGALTGASVDRLERHEHLKRLALTDPMTGLANRRAVDELMERWASDPRLARTMTVVLCDVNGLKQVNDTFGHASGDQLICETATVIATCSGLLPDAVAARIGGDEFLIASPDADPDQVARALDELVTAASLLTLGGGLSCGSARGDDITRDDVPPAARVRALLRMADAEQYRNKLAARQRRAGATGDDVVVDARVSHTPVISWAPSRDFADATGTVTAVVDHLRSSDDPVEVRLGLVAAAVCEVTFGAAWWVSRIDLAHGTIRSLHCGTCRAEGDRDGAWQDVELDQTDYPLSRYPGSAHAMAQRSFSADADHGDAGERHLLLELGFSSVIGTGGRGPVDDEAWLVEVYGDALTPELARCEALLHLMCMLALDVPRLTPAGDLAPDRATGNAFA